jgi:sterol desaturase/sphingolipid hydroxylase (fatty acid hydroxylase superfamily)
MPTHPKTSPKDFFLHLLAMIALYGSAVSFTAVVFQYINLGIPDPIEQAQYFSAENARDIIRRSLSFLIILFPVYLATVWQLLKIYKKHPEKLGLWVRRWLTYLTLFVAALIIIFDLVALVNKLLDGELTTRFFLKVIAILFVAGSIFGYYLWDIRKHKTE